MHVVSVNTGRREVLEYGSYRGETGIFKQPLEGRIAVGELGLEGDVIVDGRHHGGPDQAVYLYRQEDYHWWSGQLGQTLGPGTFGDNLTVTGLSGPGLVIGSRLVFDDLLLEVTAPRIPCNTLAARMGDNGFPRRFVRAERPGLYCRVLKSGSIAAGDGFTVEPYTPAAGASTVTTLELFRDAHRRLGAAELQRYLAAPIDQRTRADFSSRLSRHGVQADSAVSEPAAPGGP